MRLPCQAWPGLAIDTTGGVDRIPFVSDPNEGEIRRITAKGKILDRLLLADLGRRALDSGNVYGNQRVSGLTRCGAQKREPFLFHR